MKIYANVHVKKIKISRGYLQIATLPNSLVLFFIFVSFSFFFLPFVTKIQYFGLGERHGELMSNGDRISVWGEVWDIAVMVTQHCE